MLVGSPYWFDPVSQTFPSNGILTQCQGPMNSMHTDCRRRYLRSAISWEPLGVSPATTAGDARFYLNILLRGSLTPLCPYQGEWKWPREGCYQFWLIVSPVFGTIRVCVDISHGWILGWWLTYIIDRLGRGWPEDWLSPLNTGDTTVPPLLKQRILGMHGKHLYLVYRGLSLGIYL